MANESKGKSTAPSSSDGVSGLVNELVSLVQAAVSHKGGSVGQHSSLKEAVVADTRAAALSSSSSSSSNRPPQNIPSSFRRRSHESFNGQELQQGYMQYQASNGNDPQTLQQADDGRDVVNYLSMVDYTEAVESMDATRRAQVIIQSFADADDIVAYLNDPSTQYAVDVWGAIPPAFAQQLREGREQVRAGDGDGSAVHRLRQIQRQLKSKL